MDAPPEMVDGIVIMVMTSRSLLPANRAKNPPMDWIPSWELPASRIVASEISDARESFPLLASETVVSLIENMKYICPIRPQEVRTTAAKVTIFLDVSNDYPF